MAATTVLGFGLFFAELRSVFGWSSTATSAAFSFQRLQGGIIQPISGLLVDRVGSRTMAIFGIFIVGTGFLLFSQVTELWQFYAILVYISAGMSIGVGTALNSSLVNWFQRNRSKALGVVWSGTPAAGILVFGLGLMIDRFGWDAAAFLIGAVILAVGLPLTLVIRHRPEPYGYQPDGDDPSWSQTNPNTETSVAGLSVSEALRSKEFWLLAVGIGAEMTVIQSIVIHQIAHMQESGRSFTEASFVASAMALAFLLGRLPYAFVGDRADKRLMLTTVLILVGLGVIALESVENPWAAALYILLVGVGHGALVPLRIASVADWMGTARFASIMGILELPAIIGGVLGPLFMGLIFDARGNYEFAIYTFGFMLLAVAPVFVLLPKSRFSTVPQENDPTVATDP